MVLMKQNIGQDLLWAPVFNLCRNVVDAQLVVSLFHTVLVLSKDKSIHLSCLQKSQECTFKKRRLWCTLLSLQQTSEGFRKITA